MKKIWLITLLVLASACVCGLRPAMAQTSTPVGLQVFSSDTIDTSVDYETGTSYTFSFFGAIGSPPLVGDECTLQGPNWSWNFSGAAGTVTSNNSTGTLAVTFTTPGTYTITATAAVSYNTSGSDCGGPYSDSNSASITITVINPSCPTS